MTICLDDDYLPCWCLSALRMTICLTGDYLPCWWQSALRWPSALVCDLNLLYIVTICTCCWLSGMTICTYLRTDAMDKSFTGLYLHFYLSHVWINIWPWRVAARYLYDHEELLLIVAVMSSGLPVWPWRATTKSCWHEQRFTCMTMKSSY